MKFTLVKEKCSLVDNQKIEIQEIPERVPSGAQPSSGMVILEGDLVNRVLPGTRIIANMVPQMHSERKGTRKTPLFEIFYNMVSMETETEPFTEINIDQEDIEKILKLVNDHPEPELLKLVTSSIAPSIFATPASIKLRDHSHYSCSAAYPESHLMEHAPGGYPHSPDGRSGRGKVPIVDLHVQPITSWKVCLWRLSHISWTHCSCGKRWVLGWEICIGGRRSTPFRPRISRDR